jgi:mitochondrial fission protein ELM1
MRNQALGLAEAVSRLSGAAVAEKTIAVREPWRSLPAALWGDPFARLEPGGGLAPPWPDVLVACGRLTIPFSMALKDECLTVQCQDPRTDPRRFGLVVPPAHDLVEGPNVFPILGSPNRLTEARLEEDADVLGRLLPPLPRPLSAFLIGGPSGDFRMTPAALNGIADVMEEAARLGQGLLVTFSRRTPEGAMTFLLEALEALPAWVWDGHDLPGLGNPYFGLLGLADRLFVTAESANMLAEAGFTGRPVHALPLQGGAAKWRRFHEQLAKHGVLNPEAGIDEDWAYEPLRETERAAEAVVAAWKARG